MKSKDKIEVTLSADKTDENDDESDDTGSDKQSKSDDKSSDKHKSDSSSKSDSKNSSSSDSKKTPIAIQIINQVPMTIVNGTETNEVGIIILGINLEMVPTLFINILSFI